MMRDRSFLLQPLTLLLFAVSLVACGRTDTNDAAETARLQSRTPIPGSTSLAEPAAGSSPIATTDTGSLSGQDQIEASFPEDFAAMLDSLGDYQLELSVSFEGRDEAGAPVAFEWRSRELVLTDPRRSRLDLETIRGDQRSEIETLTLVRYDETGYVYVPSVGCVSVSTGDSNFEADMALPLETTTLLNGISSARPLGTGIAVNGIETTEFDIDETSVPWSPTGPWSVTGSAFVEVGDKFITRIVLNVSGHGDLLERGRVLDGEYVIIVNVIRNELSEAVIVPAACSKTFLYPVTPDAYGVTAIEDLLSFKSRLSLIDVVDFYLNTMPASGWQLLSEPDVFDDLAILNYQRDEGTLMITAEYDPETNTIGVLISP